MLDTYKNVTAYYNGTNIKAGCLGPGAFGIQYECPEYINRFYEEAKGVNTNTSAWLRTDGSQYYAKAKQLKLVAYPNCTTYPQTPCAVNTLPQPDDIVSFCNFNKATGSCATGPAHAAVIESITTSGAKSTITFIEENYGEAVRATVSVTQNSDGTYTMADHNSGTLRAYGWLRLPPPSGPPPQ